MEDTKEPIPQSPEKADEGALSYKIRTMASDQGAIPPQKIQPREPTSSPKPEPEKKRHRGLPVLFLLVIIVLVLAGMAYLYRSLIFTGGEPPIVRLDPPAPYFGIETSQTLTITEDNRPDFKNLIQAALSQEERKGSFKRLLILLKTPTGDRYAELRDLFSFFNVAPTSFSFTPIEPSLMTFAYFGNDGPHFGFIAKTNDRERVLSAMARWEETLAQDFEPFYLDATLSKPGIFEEYSYRNTRYKYLPSAGSGQDPSADSEQNPSASGSGRGIAYMVFPAEKYLVVTTSRESMERIIERLFDAL
jgi:hypothetical protein